MENKIINKKAQTSGVMMIGMIVAVIALVLIVVFLFMSQRQTIFPGDRDGVEEIIFSDTLIGKASTVSVNARDISADDVTTRRTVPVYIKDPSGNYVASGGTATSTTVGQDFTTGIKVVDPDATSQYMFTAFNNTYGSVNGEEAVSIPTQSESIDLDVYTIASASVQLTLFDTNDIAMTNNITSLTLGAGETGDFTKIKIKNNQTNTGYRIFGFFVTLKNSSTSDIQTVNFQDDAVGADGSMPLRRTTLDDFTFKLTTPVLLFEFQEAEFGPITVEADGDDPQANDTLFINVVDGEYFFSQKGLGVLFASENDATSAADVGAGDSVWSVPIV